MQVFGITNHISHCQCCCSREIECLRSSTIVCCDNFYWIAESSPILFWVYLPYFLQAFNFLITSPTLRLILSCISRHQCVYLQLAGEGLWSGNSIYLHWGFWHQPLVPRTNARLFKVQPKLIFSSHHLRVYFHSIFSETFFSTITHCLNDYTDG